MSAAEDLASFEATAEAVRAEDLRGSTFPPSIYLHLKTNKGKGLFVFGTFLRLKTADSKKYKKDNGEWKKDYYIEMRLIQTNAEATQKVGTGYKPVAVKAGDIITVIATNSLARFVRTIDPGYRIKILYVEKGIVEGPDGKEHLGHIFEMKRNPGVLSEEDRVRLASFAKLEAPAVIDDEPSDAAANLTAI